MIKYILVPATGSASDAAVFDTALEVARGFGAHLEFLHVRMDPQRVMAAMSSDYSGVGFGIATDIGGIMDAAQRDADGAEERAQAAVQEFRVREGLLQGSGERPCTAEWQREIGDEGAVLVQRGRTSDLVAIGRQDADGGTASALLEEILLGTGRPLLLVPPASARPRRPIFGSVVVAWKDTREAAHAVAAAGPFIDRAEAVVVCTVDEDDPGEGREPTGASRERLVHALGFRHSNVTSRHLASSGRDPIEALFKAAADAGANLLVMGGYGHSRLREALFGGFTRRVLKDCDLPVLITH